MMTAHNCGFRSMIIYIPTHVLILDHSKHINCHVTNISNRLLHVVCNHFHRVSQAKLEQVVNEDSAQSF